jgi:hypothetical protein
VTDEQIGALTLGELERIAERFGRAVGDIRAAQSLLGRGSGGITASQAAASGSPPLLDASDATPSEPEDPAAAHRRRQFQPVEAQQPSSLRVKDPLRRGPTATDIAERNRIMGRGKVDPNLPEEIQAMEREQ